MKISCVRLTRALQKRPVSEEQFEALIARVLHKISGSGEREIFSDTIGDMALTELLPVDEVAYIRFASVYRSFQDIQAFKAIVLGLEMQEQ